MTPSALANTAAFPLPGFNGSEGLTVRQLFSGWAMHALLSRPGADVVSAKDRAFAATEEADALIEMLAKRGVGS